MEGNNKRIKLSHHSNFEIPQIGAGTFEIKKSDDILCAIRFGYRHLDLSENYHNLGLLRKSFRVAFLSISDGGLGIDRKTIFITMKVLYIRNQSHISDLLTTVGLEYFDLLLYHTPNYHFTSEEAMQKSWRTMILEKNSGKVLQIGVSNYYKQHLDRLLHFCNDQGLPFPFANQIMVNPYVFPKETIDFCKYWNIKVIAYCPLGYLYSRWILEEPHVTDIALKLRCSPSQVVLSWLLKQGLYVIPRSSNAEHLKSNLESNEVNWHMNEVEEHDCEEKMRTLRKSNDEEVDFMIDKSKEAYFQQIHWGNECIMQPFTLVL